MAYGEYKAFSLHIAPDNVAQGSTVCPGTPLVDDANDWKVLILFLDDDSWNWEGFAQQNKEYLDVDVPIQMP